MTDTCAGCGLTWGDLAVESFGPALRSLDHRYAERLASDDAALRRRPAPAVWSPLEYACHVRDVLLVQRERVYLALVEDRPSFARMYREERVELARYGEASAGAVRSDLAVAYRLLAVALTGRTETDWARPLVYNYPSAEEHDLAWLGRHTIHECEHHLVDIDRGLAAGDAGAWSEGSPADMHNRGSRTSSGGGPGCACRLTDDWTSQGLDLAERPELR